MQSVFCFSLCLRITTPKILVFLGKFGSLAGLLRQNQNFRVLNFSAGERKLKYPGPGFWTQPGISGSTRTHLFFVLLRASVPPWCKGLVFGCRHVTPCFRFFGFAFAVIAWVYARRRSNTQEPRLPRS